MLNIFRLQRNTLSVLIAFYLIGVILAGLLVLGVYLWTDKTNDRQHVLRDISFSEIGSSLHYNGEVILPAWRINRISLFDDSFTSPNVTVDFDNGVTVMLSESSFTVKDGNGFTVKRGGLTYYYKLPGRLTDSDLAKLKEEVNKSLATPRTVDSGLRGVAA